MSAFMGQRLVQFFSPKHTTIIQRKTQNNKLMVTRNWKVVVSAGNAAVTGRQLFANGYRGSNKDSVVNYNG